MIKRQQRLLRIVRVEQEYFAARTASSLLSDRLAADPGYGWDQGWEPRAGRDFSRNVEATYIIRMYAEFEAGLRDYWTTHLRKTSRPAMSQLVRTAIPNQLFSQDCIDNADDVRKYRNFLVHDSDEEPSPDLVVLTVTEAKKYLCDYFGRLDATWK